MPRIGIIPARAIGDKDLTHADIRVLCAIGIHVNWQTGLNCFASASTIAAEAGVEKRSFFRATARLIAKGYVRKQKRNRRNGSTGTSVYDVLLDTLEPGWEEDTSPEPEFEPEVSPGLGSDRVVTSDRSGHPPVTQPGHPRNMVLNASPSSGLVPEEYQPDLVELITRVAESSKSTTAWLAETKVAEQGMHGPARTKQQIGQAIRDFNANGADLNLRLFRAYLAGTVQQPKPTFAGISKGSKPWQAAEEREARDRAIVAVRSTIKAVDEIRATMGEDWWEKMKREAKDAGRYVHAYVAEREGVVP